MAKQHIEDHLMIESHHLIEKMIHAKGQIISKWFFDVFDFLQKTNENKSIRGIIVVKSNSFVRFLEEVEDIKTPFEINWPLKKLTRKQCWYPNMHRGLSIPRNIMVTAWVYISFFIIQHNSCIIFRLWKSVDYCFFK